MKGLTKMLAYHMSHGIFGSNFKMYFIRNAFYILVRQLLFWCNFKLLGKLQKWYKGLLSTFYLNLPISTFCPICYIAFYLCRSIYIFF